MKLVAKIGWVAIALATFAAAGLAAHGLTEASAAVPSDNTLTTLQDSVVRLDIPGGEICSGWILKGSGKVMTAAHCFASDDPKKTGKTSAEVTFNDGHKGKYKLTKMGDYNSVLRDWAVLEPTGGATGPMPVGLPVCKDKPYYGQPVVIMGSPLGVDKIMFFGQVANPSYKTHEEFSADLNDLVVFSMQTYQGNSGGPIIDQTSGCVVAQAELLITVGNVPLGIGTGIPISAEQLS